jgi:23S rRNA (uracil1939-C5)-methyltransferase
LKKDKLQIIENLEIIDIGAEGNALGKFNDIVVFVGNSSVPGDIADVIITKKRKRYYEAKPVKFHTLSALRTKPFCKYFGYCGGCTWQHLMYSEQLKYKQKQVSDQLTRIGKVDIDKINPIIGADNTTFYRNKLEFTFSDKRWLTNEEFSLNNNKIDPALGFHLPKYFDKVIDIEYCYLQREPSNIIRNAIKKFAIENNISFFNIKQQSGLLRNLIIRTSSTGEIMVIISFYFNDEKNINSLLNYVADEFPEITSLLYVINTKPNDTINDLKLNKFKGNDYIIEYLGELKFKISPKSFFQTNTQQAYKLYELVKSFTQIKQNELVYDLYTGTGTIANYVANSAKKVVGIEYIEDAIFDAIENSKINNISNTEFIAGDIKEVLNNEFISIKGKPDVIILDPPRAGVHPNVCKVINDILPERLVYVSCNPATQARDINILSQNYFVAKVQPVDMFPHTMHVENVALLMRKV